LIQDNDIIYNIMDKKKLNKIAAQLRGLRNSGGIKSRELESIAKSLGRKQHSRGSEPTWISTEFPSQRPLSIPHHSKELNRNTAGQILDQLEDDIECHRLMLELETEEGENV